MPDKPSDDLILYRIEKLEEEAIARERELEELRKETEQNTALRKQFRRLIKTLWSGGIAVGTLIIGWIFEHFVLGRQ